MITFNASSSYDPDGTIISYEWDFGDGSNSSGIIVNHTYSDFGSYPVILKVNDNDNVFATHSQEIKVYVNVVDNLYINSNSVLLSGFYKINDSNGDGVIVINTSNVTLDCNYAVFVGNGSGYWIYNPGFDNVTIKNCRIENYTYGLYIKNANGTKISNNEISNNKVGIYSQNSTSIIDSNFVCGNINLDFNSSAWLSSYGDNNTCDNAIGCRYSANGKAKDIFDAVEMLEYLNGKFNYLTHGMSYYNLNNDTTINLLDVLALIDKIVIEG